MNLELHQISNVCHVDSALMKNLFDEAKSSLGMESSSIEIVDQFVFDHMGETFILFLLKRESKKIVLVTNTGSECFEPLVSADKNFIKSIYTFLVASTVLKQFGSAQVR